jgi:hypothetical protein
MKESISKVGASTGQDSIYSKERVMTKIMLSKQDQSLNMDSHHHVHLEKSALNMIGLRPKTADMEVQYLTPSRPLGPYLPKHMKLNLHIKYVI